MEQGEVVVGMNACASGKNALHLDATPTVFSLIVTATETRKVVSVAG